jgi:subtilisin family serine protease
MVDVLPLASACTVGLNTIGGTRSHASIASCGSPNERCESEDAVKRILLVTGRIIGLAAHLNTRRVRVALGCGVVVPFVLTIWAGLPPRALEAQSLPDAAVRTPVITTVGVAAPAAFHPSRVLVRFRNGAPNDFLPGSPSASDFPGQRNLHLVQNPPGLSVAEVVGRYHLNPNVLYAEPDFIVQTDVIPTDPLWNQQWDMTKISAPTAWITQTDSSGVVVAVIDTGIDFTHPDLLTNLWTNSDGSHGFDCMNGRCTKGGSDGFGHGTHVAGTIGAAANNNIGIAGINWKVQLMSLKFLDANGSGFTSDAVLAFDQVTALKQQGVNVRVTSNSWGGGGFSQSLKDAMARGEAAGILHVCAAGNSNHDADSFPMYPGAYDNRGIISVLASDPNDVGASFTNYGLATVDIAAPGVSTLSTVPRGTCTLCDPSGYKPLSGTSMATPHVSGVLAALFKKNAGLTPNQARDVVLDPASYDTLSDAKAKSTSTGGRLNFAKALANPLLSAPRLNNFPILAMGPDVLASAGSKVNLTAAVSDPDNDPLRVSWARSADTGLSSMWLFGWMLNSIFPNLGGSSVSFTAPSLARTAIVPYDAAVADGRGGSAEGREWVTVSPGSAGKAPSGALTVSPTVAPAGSTITVSFPVTASKNGQVGWDLWLATQNSAHGACCFTGTSTTVTLNTPGVYRIGTQAIDQTLSLSPRPSVVVRIGGATGEPPIASATLDTLSGPVPLTVNIDASASVDPDGTIGNYYFACGDTNLIGSRKPRGSCTFKTPGTYWIEVMVQDGSGNVDLISAYVVATR